MSRRKRIFVVGGTVLSLLIAAPAFGHGTLHGAEAPALQDTGYIRREQRVESLPAVAMTNQDGERIFLPDLMRGDDPVMFNFIYTTCTTVCPVLSAGFSEVEAALGPDAQRLRMISISIDPEHDTPEKLKDYAKRYRAAERWQFLTGSLSDTIDVQKAFDAYRRDKMSHVPLTFLRAPAQQAWLRLEGFPSVAEVVEEYRAANAQE